MNTIESIGKGIDKGTVSVLKEGREDVKTKEINEPNGAERKNVDDDDDTKDDGTEEVNDKDTNTATTFTTEMEGKETETVSESGSTED